MKEKTHLEWAQEFTDLLTRFFKENLKSVVLYGSVARGKEHPESDIDLLIVLEGLSGGRYQRRRVLDGIFDEWNRAHEKENVPFISTVLKSPAEAGLLSPLYFDMVDRGRILVDQDDFMKEILLDVKERLARLGARRRQLGKVEYWDLKPDYKPGDIFEI